jgi:hypothetical protein
VAGVRRACVRAWLSGPALQLTWPRACKVLALVLAFLLLPEKGLPGRCCLQSALLALACSRPGSLSWYLLSPCPLLRLVTAGAMSLPVSRGQHPCCSSSSQLQLFEFCPKCLQLVMARGRSLSAFTDQRPVFHIPSDPRPSS